MDTSEEIVQSPAFLDDLESLNTCLIDSLKSQGLEPVLNGNVLYGHLQADFHTSSFQPRLQSKREAVIALAQRSKCWVEVGVAGGHALLLALHANPELRAIGVDEARWARPSWPRVDVYVPAAFQWFETRFPDRVRMIKASSIDGLKTIAKDAPFGSVDAVHLDAGKDARLQEVQAIWPALSANACLMQGDNVNGHVRKSTQDMQHMGLARPPRNFPVRARSRFFDVQEIGPAVLEDKNSLNRLHGQKVLICTAHQDDESLFCGHLLNALSGKADITIACFFRPAPGRKDTATREATLARLCDDLSLKYIQFPHAVEEGENRLRRHIALDTEPEHIRGRPRAPVSKHPLFARLKVSVMEAMERVQPHTVITHNANGEYGHREHIMLHHAVRSALEDGETRTMLSFGVNHGGIGFSVDEGPKAKQRLLDYYKPQWHGAARYDFALAPEVFVLEELKTAGS